VFYKIYSMNKAIFFASVFACATTIMTSCNQDYDCNCAVDLPDPVGVSLDFDTTFTFEKTTEELATTQCNAYESASSVLIPSGVNSSDADINCVIQ